MLTIALTKGRLQDKALELFKRIGIDAEVVNEKSRKLIFEDNMGGVRFVLAKASDVITYVEHGVCDMGVVGKDTIAELDRPMYEVLDLGFGKCKFVLAVKEDADFYSGYKRKVIATKYPNVTRKHFEKKGMDIEIIKIEGSVELAPLLGISDAIVDITETGTTLRENGLKVIEDVAPISARLVVNLASMKMKKAEISSFIDKCSAALEV